jgi:hypothetical protein
LTFDFQPFRIGKTMSFDPQSFLDSSINSANDTKVIPVPAGEFTGIVDKVAARQWTSKDGTMSGVTLDVTWLIDDEAVKQELGRPTVTCRQGIMLDMTPGGGLDMGKGKNVGLGRLREALNLNKPGQPFSFSMLPGQAGKVTVSHRVDGEDTYAEIKKVAPL